MEKKSENQNSFEILQQIRKPMMSLPLFLPHKNKPLQKLVLQRFIFIFVGVAGFEPAAPAPKARG